MTLPQNPTLLEFVVANLPESWAKYSAASGDVLIKPWQTSAPIAQVAAQQLWPSMKEAAVRAKAEYRELVNHLTNVLPQYELLADDANHNAVILHRRHWASAIFEFENNALRRGDQRWTNIEVRAKTQTKRVGATSSSRAQAAKPAPEQKSGAKAIDDEVHIARFMKEHVSDPSTTIRDFVLRHDDDIEGASLDAKIRRLQRRLKDRT